MRKEQELLNDNGHGIRTSRHPRHPRQPWAEHRHIQGPFSQTQLPREYGKAVCLIELLLLLVIIVDYLTNLYV